jgi:hypothetical protein
MRVSIIDKSGITLYAVWGSSAAAGEAEGVRVVTESTSDVVAVDAAAPVSTVVLPTAESHGLVKEGHVLLGWATTAGATEPEAGMLPGASYEIPATGLDIYAVWGLAPVAAPADHIFLLPESVSTPVLPLVGAPEGVTEQEEEEEEEEDDATIVLPNAESQGFAMEGHTFLGWSTSPDATEPDPGMLPGAKFTIPEGSLNVYAVWAPTPKVKGEVNFNQLDPQSVETSNAAEPSTAAVPQTDDSTTPKEGHTFLGWSTSPNASKPDAGLGASEDFTIRVERNQ